MNGLDEEILKKKILKKVSILPSTIIIRCDLCDSFINPNYEEFFRQHKLPNEEFCKYQNTELIRRIYKDLIKKRFE
jgi:hypothetical protein